MAEQQRQSLCPRLIDYLAIVGSRSTNIKHPGNGQNPPVQVNKYLLYIQFSLFIQFFPGHFLSDLIKVFVINRKKMPRYLCEKYNYSVKMNSKNLGFILIEHHLLH